MKWMIGNVLIPNRYVLAPMAGVTSTTFRSICKSLGAGLVVGEMVSDKALIYESKKTYELLKMDEKERPISQQIFGSDPKTLGKAAKIIEDVMHPDIIDINMGCPVPKIALKNHAGSYLLKDPDLIYEIVSSVVKSVSVPVTVKIRAGWDNKSINAPLVAKKCEEAGASAIFIHGRTRKDGYSGHADLNIIKEVVNAVNIPVIGNGDITSFEDAKKMLDETNCTAVMIGRGALGNPWIFQQCLYHIDNIGINKEVTLLDKIEMMKYHTLKLQEEKGEHIAVLELRTALMYYLKGMPHTKEVKLKLIAATSIPEILSIIDNYKQEVMNGNNREY